MEAPPRDWWGTYLPAPGEGSGRQPIWCCPCFSCCPGWQEMGVIATSGGPWGHPGHHSPSAWRCSALKDGQSHSPVVRCSLRGSPEAGLERQGERGMEARWGIAQPSRALLYSFLLCSYIYHRSPRWICILYMEKLRPREQN